MKMFLTVGLVAFFSLGAFADNLRSSNEEGARKLSTSNGAVTTDESGTLAEVCGGFEGRWSGNCARLRGDTNEYRWRAGLSNAALAVTAVFVGWNLWTGGDRDTWHAKTAGGFFAGFLAGNLGWDWFAPYSY